MKRSVALRVFRLKTLLLNESFHSIVAIGSIENSLHYVRDVTFNEDLSTVRTKNAPRVMASFKILSSAFSDGFHVPLLKK